MHRKGKGPFLCSIEAARCEKYRNELKIEDSVVVENIDFKNEKQNHDRLQKCRERGWAESWS